MSNHDGDYRYVPHSEAKQWEALGWEFTADLGPPHCVYASLYKWAGEGEPVFPQKTLFESEEVEREMRERAKQLRDFDEIFGIGGDGE